MFSYYGSKSKLVWLYPPPRHRHDTIIEPFAGSARYSLAYWRRDVFLYDTNEIVVRVWKYLISASERDVLSLPDVESKRNIDEIKSLSQEERWLIGFHLCRGKAVPRKVGHGQNSWSRDKVRIARDLHKIRHFKIERKSYTSIRNRDATWFIDPPYKSVNVKENGDRYPECEIDYEKLAKFALSRRGLVICCEGAGADYLPFKLLTVNRANTNSSTVKQNVELIYTRRSK